MNVLYCVEQNHTKNGNSGVIYIGTDMMSLPVGIKTSLSAVTNPKLDILEKKLESFSQDQHCIIEELIP